MDSIGGISIRRWIFGRLWRVAVFGSIAFFVVWLFHWMGRTTNKVITDPSQYMAAEPHLEESSEYSFFHSVMNRFSQINWKLIEILDHFPSNHR